MNTEKYGVIYKATFPNNKSYIGKTKNFKERKQAHYYASINENNKQVFYLAIRKYGWENIKWEIIDEAVSLEELNKKEKYWIQYYNTCIIFKNSSGYNMTFGGEDGSIPEIFITEEEINHILERFKQCGSITIIANELKCSYNLIREIVQGEIRTELTGFNNRDFYNKYRIFSKNRTLEDIQEVISLSEKYSTKEIEQITGISQRYVQDILSGRIYSKISGIKRITRNERQLYNPVNSKLKKEEVLKIVNEYYNEHKTVSEISDLHNLNSSRISEIILGRTWSKVTGIKPKEKQKIMLTKTQVLEIVKESKINKDYNLLAKKYNTNVKNIKRILSGETWSKVTNIKK